MAEKNLKDLLLHTLKDVFFAENEILKALPKMKAAATDPALKDAFEKHRGQTEGQIERLRQVFDILGEPAKGVPCEAIKGIIAEGEEVVEEFGGSQALDAGLIAAAQAVEHYEISRYGALRSWADQLGLDNAANLLEETLEEEIETDQALTELAEAQVNIDAE